MATVERPTSSMNGNIKFTIGAEDNTEDVSDAENLQEEVTMLPCEHFHPRLIKAILIN